MEIFLVAASSYCCGSIPFGLILTKLFIGKDIRKMGSGNIGATNVLRTGNKYLALVTLILDVLKGYVPVIVTKYFFPEFLQISANPWKPEFLQISSKSLKIQRAQAGSCF